MPTPQGNPKAIDQSTIPPAVRRQAEAADRRMREASGQQEPPPAPPPDPGPPQPTNPEPPRQAAPPPPASQPDPPSPPPADPADENNETWKHKFESEQGRALRLRQDVSRLSEEVSNLRNLLSTVQPAPPPAQTPSFELPDPLDTLTAEEKQEWGEMLPVLSKVAKRMSEATLGQVQERLKDVGQSVVQVRQHAMQNDRDKMLGLLDDPNHMINKSGRPFGRPGDQPGSTWRDINRDPEFLNWLEYPDPLSGMKRLDMLTSAFNANDASRVAAFFANFLREVAAVDPQPQPQPGTPVTPQGNTRPSLEAFAAPGRPRAAAPQDGPAAPEVITTADISRFYSDLRAGRFKGKEKIAEEYEQKIFAASKAGTVQPVATRPS